MHLPPIDHQDGDYYLKCFAHSLCAALVAAMVDRRRVEEAHEGAAHEDEEDKLHVEHLAAQTLRK